MIVDVVTSRTADLHGELLAALGGSPAIPPLTRLFAAAYRPTVRDAESLLECWHEGLELDMDLPQLPLHIGPDLVVPVDLDTTHAAALQRRRIGS